MIKAIEPILRGDKSAGGLPVFKTSLAKLIAETKDKAHALQAIGKLEAEGFQVSRLEGWGGRVLGAR